MPQVDNKIIKQRAKILRNLGEKKLSEHFEKLKNKKINVIVERSNKGRTDGFAKVFLNNELKSTKVGVTSKSNLLAWLKENISI